MKLKKGLIALIVSILILSIATISFATTDKKEKVENVVANKVSNTVSNETKKTENKTENKTANTVKNETVKNETKKTETTSKKTTKVDVMNQDVVNAETEENLEYSDVIVKGNMFLANSDKITFTGVQVDGDVIVFASEIEIVDSEIEGNLFAAADKITILGSDLNSVYVTGETLRFDEDTEISRELRVVGQTVTFNAKSGRDAYVVGETVKFGDDAVVKGKAIVRSENKSVSEDAKINDLDYKKANTYGIVTIASTESRIISYLIGKGTEIAIILIITLFVLYGFPKFSEVNSCLRLRDFVRAFFTGLLEFFVIIAIVIGLFFTIYGVGYGLIIFNLLITFVVLGKVIFIISFAVRMSCSPEKISKVKAFFATVLVALVLAVIEMISLAGYVGFIINLVINCILAFTGFGSMFRVILTSKKKLEKLAVKKLEGKPSKVQEVVTPVGSPVVEEVPVDKTQEAGASELEHEVKVEIKEEIEELKEEREEEKKLDESSSEKTEKTENVEEPKIEQTEEKKEENTKDDKKEDDDK